MGWGKRSQIHNIPKGKGPDVAKVGGWWRRGKYVLLEGGTGLFKYETADGTKKTASRFTLGGRKKKGE